MSRKDLLSILKVLRTYKDSEVAHVTADKALLLYLDDEDIAEAYKAIEKVYA